MAYRKTGAREWLEAHISYTGDGCLTHPFPVNKDGRGRVAVNGKRMYMATYMCELVNGPKILPEHEAAHSCGNGHKACVHPKHLRWATRLENSQDSFIHCTKPVGSSVTTAKLTEENVSAIRVRLKELICRKNRVPVIAKEFGVSITTIKYIKDKKSWKHHNV